MPLYGRCKVILALLFIIGLDWNLFILLFDANIMANADRLLGLQKCLAVSTFSSLGANGKPLFPGGHQIKAIQSEVLALSDSFRR